MTARALGLAGLFGFALAVNAIACGERAPDLPSDTPGGSAYDGELACKVDGDCQKGESCTGGVCQLKRCEGNVIAGSPLGKAGYLSFSRELVVAATSTSVQGYSATDNSLVRVGSSRSTEAKIVDVAGGNLVGTRPDAIAVAVANASHLEIIQGGNSLPSVGLGFVPVAIASGDADGDGIDEVFATTSDGKFAVCKVQPGGGCTTYELGVDDVVDIAAADVDGDGYTEAVFASEENLVVYNFDSDKTSQARVMNLPAGRSLTRIAAGDIDGDGIDEVVGLEDGNLWFWDYDKVHVFAWDTAGFALKGSAETERGSKDVSVDYFEAENANVAVLGKSDAVHVLAWKDAGLRDRFTTTMAGANGATRLASADVDGNSPKAKLKGESRIVAGQTVPIAVLSFPPYSSSFSQGPSSVSLGSSETNGKNEFETVALSAGATVSAGFDIPEVFRGGISVSYNASISRTKAFTKAVTIGDSFNVTAKPDVEGYDTGEVIIACGCYQQFEYDVEDPGHVLGRDADGKPMSVFVPIGGHTSAWSLRRYNELAKALGNMPTIKLPYSLGNVNSYPRTPQTLDGKPISPEDILFPKTKSFRVSDSASVSFSLNVSETTVNNQAVSKGVSGALNFGAGPVNGSVTAGITFGSGYDLFVGTGTTFSGAIEPIRNKRETPEDEFKLHAYSFTPMVYRERYLDQRRQEAIFYVMTYTAGD